MSFREFVAGELIDIIEWIDETGDVMVSRFSRPNNEIKNGAQLIVRPGQIAVFVNQGTIADIFHPGRHTLATKNLPVLSRFQREHAHEMTVIGVNFRDLASDSSAFVRRLHVTFPALLDDPSGPVGRRYGVRGLPQTLFIGADGIVRGRVYGQTSRRDLQPAITDLLAGRDVRPV